MYQCNHVSTYVFLYYISVQNLDKNWNNFCFSVKFTQNLDYEWSVKRDEDCWYVCGEKGGSCSACKLNGDDGYCCSQTRLDLNGDCPTEAVNAIISSSDSEMHQCVRKINSGK